MLPDFPSLKKDLERLLQLGARAHAASTSGTAVPLPRRDVHEGDRHILVRENGETVEDTYENVSAKDSIQTREVETLTLNQAFDMYAGLMGKIDDQEQAAFVELANREAESRGQVVEGAGRPLPEVIMESVDRMELDPAPRDVDDLFRFQGVRFMLHELDEERVAKAREELKREPYEARMEQLLRKKSEEHRARESSRKLVG